MIELDSNDITEEELKDMAQFNKESIIKVLDISGYDSSYLLEWGLPTFWKEAFWSYPEYVTALCNFFERKFGVNISSKVLNSVFDEE
jgi:hypothetical protein